MELAYLPDSLLYASGRSCQDYTQFWMDVNPKISTAQKKYNCNQKDKVDEKNCQLCRDKRRKSLSTYIRTKSKQDCESNTQLREEEEYESETSKNQNNR